MPRVLMACEPPDGGAAENATALALALRRQGNDVEYAGPPEARRRPVLEEVGVPVHGLPLAPGYGAPADDARALRALIRLLRSGRFDLVHCHSAKAGVLGRLAARTARVPAVYSPHSFSFVGDFGAPRRIAATAIERALGRTATAVVLCVCEEERRLALAHGVARPERLRVVHNGTRPCDDAVEPDPRLLELLSGGPLATAVSALRPQKALHVLLEAVPLVWERLPHARVAIVGDGPLREQLHRRARELGVLGDERFAFLPFQAPAARYLQASDVFVLPSSWEGFPISVLEALACGVPQVATRVGGTPEAVSPETGVLVPPRDPRALAEAVAALLSDAARREGMCRASRARHAERFTLERMEEQTLAIYEELAGNSVR
jgi:glycosyltransferase involved in cell wall biosynthesis